MTSLSTGASRDSILEEVNTHSTQFQGARHTWAHVSHSTVTVFVAGIVHRREPKVCEEDSGPILVAQYVKGLQVAMVDVVFVAMIHSIDDLEEDGLDARRITSVRRAVIDHVVEATPGAIIKEGSSVVAEFDVLVQSDDIGVLGEEVMEGALILPTGRFVHDFQHQLACVAAIGDAEDSAVATMSKVLFDVKFIAELPPQKLHFEFVDVRGDGHCFWRSYRWG